MKTELPFVRIEGIEGLPAATQLFINDQFFPARSLEVKAEVGEPVTVTVTFLARLEPASRRA